MAGRGGVEKGRATPSGRAPALVAALVVARVRVAWVRVAGGGPGLSKTNAFSGARGALGPTTLRHNTAIAAALSLTRLY